MTTTGKPEPARSSGYSGRPLPAKLGIKADMSVGILGAPTGFVDTLGVLPERVRLETSLRSGRRTELVVVFVTERSELERRLSRLLSALPDDGVLWVAWPKKSSKVPTDMSDEIARTAVLPTGWVDTKVCAIDETWSGLKFVLRRELRRH